VRYYFSFRSPYSWLAHRELMTRHPAVAARLDWYPFWEPDERSRRDLAAANGRFVYADMSREKHFYILQDVRRLCGERGLSITWPVDRAPHWEVPHLAYLVAARRGAGVAFTAAVYRARWEEGRDICDRTTIGEIAGGLGLDPAEAAGAADDEELRREGVAVLLRIHRDGVFGVPFFVDRYARFWGLDRLETFVAHLTAGVPREAPATAPGADGGPAAVAAGPGVDGGPGADGGHAGGCG
jgi:2-hydroxychromene-2-carboxylate isomerase